jgi:hypothetical protein
MRKKVLTCLMVTLFFVRTIPVLADLDVTLTVEGCNNDTQCNPSRGENINSCPNDCTIIPPQSTTSEISVPREIILKSMSQNGVETPMSDISFWTYSPVILTPQDSDMVLTWDTSFPTRAVISWGYTDDYEMGSVSQIEYVRQHTSRFGGIQKGVRYYFKISSRDSAGTENDYMGSFLIEKPEVIRQVPNVKSLKSFKAESGIGLKWLNPKEKNFSFIRIVRSSKSFPTSPLEGRVVYEGRGQSFLDIKVKDDVRYYYAVFVKGNADKYSSGALLTEIKYAKKTDPLDSDTGTAFDAKPVETAATGLDLKDVEFRQGDRVVGVLDGEVVIRSDSSVEISVRKTKWLQLFMYLTAKGDPSADGSVYLMRLNPETNRLEVNVPEMSAGQPISFSLQEFANGEFRQVQSGEFQVSDDEKTTEAKRLDGRLTRLNDLYMVLPIAVLLLAIRRIFHRR